MNKVVFEKYYPDRGGWTGFSILIWEVSAENYWGNSIFFILEGRYFTSGKLHEHKIECSDRLPVLEGVAVVTERMWTLMMDSYTKNHL